MSALVLSRQVIAGGTLGVVVAAIAVWYRLTRPIWRSSFTVLSWNLLAAEFTKFNHKPPGCVQGHHNPHEVTETSQQTAARYSLASDALIKRQPDAVLLQECSSEFFDISVNPRASALLTHFEVVHQTNSAGPGTAVLLRAGGPLVPTGTVVTVGANETTGGTSKSTSAVLVTVGRGTQCWLASMHVTPYKFYPAAAKAHMQLTGEALRSSISPTDDGARSLPRLVMGGDFNAEPHELTSLQLEASFLGGALARVIAPGHTGLSPDFSSPETIDHFFLSAGLQLLEVELERAPASPYGIRAAGDTAAAPVVAPSDHVWQSIRVAVD